MNAANFSDRELALWKYQRYMQHYLGTIAAVDEGVGAVLDYLEESGLDRSTIVVYTSDQGFYLGEHGWFDTRFIYEESMRSEERRVGKESVSKCRSRWSHDHYNQNITHRKL